MPKQNQPCTGCFKFWTFLQCKTGYLKGLIIIINLCVGYNLEKKTNASLVFTGWLVTTQTVHIRPIDWQKLLLL